MDLSRACRGGFFLIWQYVCYILEAGHETQAKAEVRLYRYIATKLEHVFGWLNNIICRARLCHSLEQNQIHSWCHASERRNGVHLTRNFLMNEDKRARSSYQPEVDRHANFFSRHCIIAAAKCRHWHQSAISGVLVVALTRAIGLAPIVLITSTCTRSDVNDGINSTTDPDSEYCFTAVLCIPVHTLDFPFQILKTCSDVSHDIVGITLSSKAENFFLP